MDIRLIIGDSAIIKVAVVDAAGRPFDMAAANIPAGLLSWNDGGQITEILTDTNGKSFIVFNLNADQQYPKPGVYPYAISVLNGSNIRYTILEGNLEFRERQVDVKQ